MSNYRITVNNGRPVYFDSYESVILQWNQVSNAYEQRGGFTALLERRGSFTFESEFDVNLFMQGLLDSTGYLIDELTVITPWSYEASFR